MYDTLTVAMIDAVAEEIGEDAMTRVLARLTDERVTSVGLGLLGLTLAQKVTALKSWYLQDDPFMEIDVSGGAYRMKERNCPFLNTAMRRPMLCSVSVNALTRILGFRVVREEKFQLGDGRCVFRVMEDQPIDPDTWEFRLESQLTP
jgi:predicted ArsR family transcriptional regulator